MMRIVAFVAALTLLGTSARVSDAAYFQGAWNCAGARWTFAALAADSPWTSIVYGNAAHPDGHAVMGRVAGLHAWVYRDFHADGSYADLTSAGLKDGRWVWSGPYYPASGGPALNGRITYTIVSPDRYDRSFASSQPDGSLKAMGGDFCTRIP